MLRSPTISDPPRNKRTASDPARRSYQQTDYQSQQNYTPMRYAPTPASSNQSQQNYTPMRYAPTPASSNQSQQAIAAYQQQRQQEYLRQQQAYEAQRQYQQQAIAAYQQQRQQEYLRSKQAYEAQQQYQKGQQGIWQPPSMGITREKQPQTYKPTPYKPNAQFQSKPYRYY